MSSPVQLVVLGARCSVTSLSVWLGVFKGSSDQGQFLESSRRAKGIATQKSYVLSSSCVPSIVQSILHGLAHSFSVKSSKCYDYGHFTEATGAELCACLLPAGLLSSVCSFPKVPKDKREGRVYRASARVP